MPCAGSSPPPSLAAMLASADPVPRRGAIGIDARRSHALRRVRPAAQDRSRNIRQHHPCRLRARRHDAAERKDAGLGPDVGESRHDLLRPLSRRAAAAAAGAGRRRPDSRRHHLGLSRRRHPHTAWPRLHRGGVAARLGDGARDGAYRPARHGLPLRRGCRRGSPSMSNRSRGCRPATSRPRRSGRR